MKQLNVPDTGVKLTEGSIVILAKYPSIKWITHYGWYDYNDQQQMGWYFSSIPDQSILPVTSDNLRYLTLVSDSGRCPHGPHLPPPPPKPVPIIPQPELIDQINRSFITVDTISERDDLDTTNFPTGKLVKVNNVEGQPKHYEWDQTKQRWLSTTFEDSVISFIYFKKECENWSTPRIYFFISQPYNLGSNQQNECWAWEDSPYMLQNDEGYYYYPLIKGYDNVIFFSDEKDNSGWNYKTLDLRIPSNEWYRNPLFVQSEIGYGGFWADYNTKQTKLLVQLNQDLFNDINLYRDSSLSAKYIDSKNNPIILKIHDFGMVINAKYYDNTVKSPYKYVKLPIDFVELTLNIESINRSSTFNLKRYEMCYEYPVAYASTTSISLQYFNAILDPNLKYKLVDNSRELMYRLEDVENNLENNRNLVIETGTLPNQSVIATSAGANCRYTINNCWYYRIGRIVYISGHAVYEYLSGPSGLSGKFQLPFTAAYGGKFKGIWKVYNISSEVILDIYINGTDRNRFELFAGTSSRCEGDFSISYVID